MTSTDLADSISGVSESGPNAGNSLLADMKMDEDENNDYTVCNEDDGTPMQFSMAGGDFEMRSYQVSQMNDEDNSFSLTLPTQPPSLSSRHSSSRSRKPTAPSKCSRGFTNGTSLARKKRYFAIDGNAPDTVHWSSKMTTLLLEEYQKYQIEMENPSNYKRHIWQRIAEAISAAGFPVTEHQCNSRWRALLHRERYRKGRNNPNPPPWRPLIRSILGEKFYEDALLAQITGQPVSKPQSTASTSISVSPRSVSSVTDQQPDSPVFPPKTVNTRKKELKASSKSFSLPTLVPVSSFSDSVSSVLAETLMTNESASATPQPFSLTNGHTPDSIMTTNFNNHALETKPSVSPTSLVPPNQNLVPSSQNGAGIIGESSAQGTSSFNYQVLRLLREIHDEQMEMRRHFEVWMEKWKEREEHKIALFEKILEQSYSRK